ncbi:MAG: ribonuclease P protein component [Alphaproteobacteria bacterium]|nr:ribonuclease P protein component [Alphaproteobacteria bacterium]MBU1526524.1 ribonuclease P protein component [Alphaproteobacteria bacterium]MBU2117118.1 ribonuclease P protein component [Alphaproteobacteria bacterium]MBU2350087.1 ribonuclease P protein component [Alphaproteobacteria bacterium]MBU2381238.1 ribonuclease P protein component [Alphaproteobacteria bacterium]
MDEAPTIRRLTRRPQFLAAAKGRSEARGAVVVQRLERGDADPAVGVGFTATRKVGGSVVRNRAKRRLREAARRLLPLLARPGSDYVLIARMGTADRDWTRLLDDVTSALTRLATPRPTPAPDRAPAAPPSSPDQDA